MPRRNNSKAPTQKRKLADHFCMLLLTQDRSRYSPAQGKQHWPAAAAAAAAAALLSSGVFRAEALAT
jgi:hypothetical protein